MLLKNPSLIDKKTGFPSTLNFPAIQRQMYVTKKYHFYISRTLPLISRLLPGRPIYLFSCGIFHSQLSFSFFSIYSYYYIYFLFIRSSSSLVHDIFPAPYLKNDTAHGINPDILFFPFNFDFSISLILSSYTSCVFISFSIILSISNTPRCEYHFSSVSFVIWPSGRRINLPALLSYLFPQ